MPTVGPTRLVLFQAGKFDFADIDLVDPLHLVGQNNVGKTSLVATLQFLYIDGQQYMHFSQDLAGTRRYYFPDRWSYVLFECLTPTGYQVVAVHGLGPLQQYNIERFSYRGRLDLNDYLDTERRIRDPDEVMRRVSDREFALLEPTNLRGCLTGTGEAKASLLGLVPVSQSGHYPHFREVFGNLLRLAHVKQDDLKKLIVSVHEHEFERRHVDLAEQYKKQYESVRIGREQLEELKRIKPDIDRTLEHVDERARLSRGLPPLWSAITERVATERTRLQAQQVQQHEEEVRLSNEKADLEKEQGTLAASLTHAGEVRGRLVERFERLRLLRAELQDFSPEWARRRLVEIQSSEEELVRRLGAAKETDVGRIETQIARLRRKLPEEKRRLEQMAVSLAVRLREHFDDEEVGALFRILNPALLSLPATSGDGEERIEVLDAKRLLERLQAIVRSQDGGTYRDSDVEVPLASLPSSDLGTYSDPKRAEEEIAEMERALVRLEEVERTLAAAEQMRKDLGVLRAERSVLEKQLENHRQYLESSAHEREWRTEDQEAEETIRAATVRVEAIQRRSMTLADAIRQNVQAKTTIADQMSTLRKMYQELNPPEPDWVSGEPEAYRGELVGLIERYRVERAREQELSTRIKETLGTIERTTYSKYTGAAEGDTIKALREEMEGLAEREKNLDQLWRSLVVEVKRAFKGLVKDLETLKLKITSLNQRLGQASVSDLSKIHLNVEDVSKVVADLKKVVAGDEEPLFVSASEVENALNRIGEILEDHPKLDLLDLFELHFEVIGADGSPRQYPNLDKIESNGTTITIKVLVNIVLLKDLLDNKSDVRIPFYLDEVASLDALNLSAIMKLARKLGFVPVLASPEARDAADRLYFLRDDKKGKIYLDGRSSKLTIRRAEQPVGD